MLNVRLLLLLFYVAFASAQDWCSQNSYLCGASKNTLSDLRCGICRSWTYSADIADNTLRLLGLDGGALPADGNSSNNYLVSASLDSDFNLATGSNWKLNLLPSSVPKTKNGALWSTKDNSTILAYGGRVPGTHSVPSDNVLPALNVKTGDWSTPFNAISLYRLTAGVSINIPDLAKAFYIGGYQDEGVATDAPQDGLDHYATSVAVFDTDTRTPSQINAPFLPKQNGAGFYIPIKAGLLVYFGGESPNNVAVNSSTATYSPAAWDHVWIYDIQEDKWYNQPASNAPDPRSEFCGAILYDEETATWQIWAIGGLDSASDVVVNSVSYLSIPSFQWHTARGAGTFMSTACVNVGPQIFVIGGRNEDTPIGGTDYPAIAYIYDANVQTSTTSYTATHTIYSAPSNIRSSGSSMQTPETWGDPALQQLFESRTTSALGGSSSASPASNPTSIGVGDNGLSGGAIGGIAAGVVVGIALVIAAVVFLLKRRRRRLPELDGNPKVLKGKEAIAEMHSDPVRHEIDGAPKARPPAELA